MRIHKDSFIYFTLCYIYIYIYINIYIYIYIYIYNICSLDAILKKYNYRSNPSQVFYNVTALKNI